jgi:hypothetical protein
MFAERQARYPKGTYKLLIIRHSGSTEYCMSNLTTSQQSRTRSIWEMIKTIEDDISANKFPESAIQYRSWAATTQAQGKADTNNVVSIDSAKSAPEHTTCGPTFILQVLFRQNATWQGTIQWIEGRQTRQYRSVNELLKLMDEAMEISPAEEPGAER